MKIILGIDPGSRRTGFGIIRATLQRTEFVASGCIRIDSEDFPAKLAEIFHGISQIIDDYAPDEMAIESVFMAKNASSALKLGQARGAAIVAGVAKHLPVFEYAARAVKQAIVGKGSADKNQVQHMVTALLNLSAKPQSDAADALAIALCHVHHQQTRIRLLQHTAQSKAALMSISP